MLFFYEIGICKGDDRFLIYQTMPFVFIQFLPARPSLGLLIFSDQQVLDSPPSQLTVGICMHSE
ncbi:hypothetical protein B5E53_06815 [Eubacterium sp. An11]|nr:hypothetical protein B5E53_06815 [Eubacterium sp. An11]